MEIRNGIDLECFIHNNTTNTLSELEIDYELSSCDIEVITFYQIDCICPYPDPNNSSKIYSEIRSGGAGYVCILDYYTLKEKIKNDTHQQ